MSKTTSSGELIHRRAELLAEFFLEDLKPEFLVRSPRSTQEFGFDFLIGFPNPKGGINNVGVEVKATEKPVADRYTVARPVYDRWVNSNIPILLLVIDVKRNRFYFGIPSQINSAQPAKSAKVKLPLVEINEQEKQALRMKLAS